MGFWSSVGSFFSSVGSAISSCFSSVASVVSSFASTILPKIASVLGGPIGTIASAIFKALGVFKESDNIDDMGDRVIQAAEQGIKLEGFAGYDEYMAKIRDFKLDSEKSKEIETEKKTAAGLFVGSLGVDKKLGLAEGTAQQMLPLIAACPDYFNATRSVQILTKVNSVLDVINYFSGSLKSPEKCKETLDNLISIEKEASPEKKQEDIFQEIRSVGKEVQDL